MTSTGLNLQHMSDSTRFLHKYAVAHNDTLGGTFVLLGVSMVAHAEAVSRAVIVFFLALQTFFSRANSEALKMQTEKCSKAYAVSLLALMAVCFKRAAIALAASDERAPVALLPVSPPVLTPGVSSLRASPALRSLSAVSPSASPPVSQEDQLDLALVRMEQSVMTLGDWEQEEVFEDDVDELRIVHEETLDASKMRVGFDSTEVARRLTSEMGKVFAEREERKKEPLFTPQQTEALIEQIERYQLGNHRMAHMIVSTCQFCDEGVAPGTLLTSNFHLSIGDKEYPVQVFGVFDAFGGSQAAHFLRGNLQRVFAALLSTHNPTALSESGIWNALKRVFVALDDCFKRENVDCVRTPFNEPIINDGATATVCIIVDGQIWTASLGNGSAILDDGYNAYPLSRRTQPDSVDFQRGVEKRGGSVVNHLVCEKVPSAKGVGFADLRGAISGRPKITVRKLFDGHLVLGSQEFTKFCSAETIHNLLEQQKDVPPDRLALNLSLSVSRAGRTPTDFSCIVVTIDPDAVSSEEWSTHSSDAEKDTPSDGSVVVVERVNEEGTEG